MCVACFEFVRDTLTLNEFKSALWEISRSDGSGSHLDEVDELIRAATGDPARLKEALLELQSGAG